MKICLIGPGIMPIPPTGWGAVEILIWDTKNALEELGHFVHIVNTKNYDDMIKEIESFQPDFVHVHYDEFIDVYPRINFPKAITSHYGYLDRPDHFGGYVNIANQFGRVKPNVFCLSPSIQKVYSVLLGIPDDKLYLSPNGVDYNAIRKTDTPEHPDRSIYLAKIDYRKRQYAYQSIDSLWFAGNIADNRFDTSKNYLGEWKKEQVKGSLTDYGNLVLLSDGEAHPLVCMEAFSAGLGVVVCQWGAANIDTTKEFITVISEDKIKDVKYVEEVMIKNREYSVAHRDEIIEYGKQFEWKEVLKRHYIPNIEKLIGRS